MLRDILGHTTETEKNYYKLEEEKMKNIESKATAKNLQKVRGDEMKKNESNAKVLYETEGYYERFVLSEETEPVRKKIYTSIFKDDGEERIHTYIKYEQDVFLDEENFISEKELGQAIYTLNEKEKELQKRLAKWREKDRDEDVKVFEVGENKKWGISGDEHEKWANIPEQIQSLQQIKEKLFSLVKPSCFCVRSESSLVRQYETDADFYEYVRGDVAYGEYYDLIKDEVIKYRDIAKHDDVFYFCYYIGDHMFFRLCGDYFDYEEYICNYEELDAPTLPDDFKCIHSDDERLSDERIKELAKLVGYDEEENEEA